MCAEGSSWPINVVGMSSFEFWKEKFGAEVCF